MSDQETTTTPPQPLSRTELIRKIANTLKERRTARSLTVEKVSQAIKIRIPYLEALENGEWDQLPAEVFVRGFIRRYAQYLGLDGDNLIAPYVNLSDAPVEKKPAPWSNQDRPGEFGRAQLVWGFFGIIFIIGFLKVIKQERVSPSKNAKPAAVIQPVAPVVPVHEKIEESKSTLASHHIEVYSPFPLWLRVTAAEKTFEGFIPQSSTWSWKGDGEFVVRLGHTKSVNLLFDGKQIALAEDQRKVVLP